MLFTFIGSSVICLSLSEIPIWTHQREFGLTGIYLSLKTGNKQMVKYDISFPIFLSSIFFLFITDAVNPFIHRKREGTGVRECRLHLIMSSLALVQLHN